MSEYQEFTGKTVEEALRNARESFGVALDDLDFEILTPGSRGVLGMGAEPARIIAAPRSALGGAAPRREAAAATPLPPPPPRPDREGDGPVFQGRDRDRGRGERSFGQDRRPRDDRGFRGDRPALRDDRPALRDERPAPRDERTAPRDERPAPRPERAPDEMPAPAASASFGAEASRPERGPRPERSSDRGGRERPRDGRDRVAPRGGDRRGGGLSQYEEAEVNTARASLASEREEIQAAEASPEALAAGKEILEELLRMMGFDATVTVRTGDTSKLDVTAEGDEKEALGALIGRKGERLSALQHLVNLMLSRRMGAWTRVLVDVEDYRGRRERQLGEIAQRAAERVVETGTMLQLEPMPALERRWIHLALRAHPDVSTQSIGEEPQRRVVILRRPG